MRNTAGKVFISYTHQDAAVAKRVAEALQSAGVQVWIDQQVAPGESAIEWMNQSLGEADYVLFLVSEASLASRWVSREWMSALADRETVVIPVRVAAVEMPPLLRDIVYIDLVADLDAGVRKIVEFFRREAVPPVQATRAPATPLLAATRRELRLVSKRCLTDLDFKECLWDLSIQESDVSGNTLQDRLLYLLQRMDSEGLVEDFVAWLEENRGGCVKHQLALLRESG